MPRSALIVASLSLLPAPSLAQTATGAAFLDLTPSARAYALGGSHTVAALGAQAVGANPANLGLMSRRFEAFSAFATLMDGMRYWHLAAAFRPSFDSLEALGLSMTRLELGGVAGADAQGNKTASTLGASDMAVTLTGGLKASANLRLGLSAKALQSDLAGYKSNMALAADVGAVYTLSRGGKPLSMAASVNNVGQGLRFRDQTDPLPLSLNVGAALPLGPATLVMGVKRAVHARETSAGTGVEMGLGPVQFRAGYLMRNDPSNLAAKDQTGPASLLSGLQAGLGVKAGAVAFDYGISQQAVEFGPTQRIALSVQWGNTAAKAERPWRHDPNRSDWMLRSMGSY